MTSKPDTCPGLALGTAQPPALAVAPSVYSAVVYLNTDPDSFDGFQLRLPLVAATHPDGGLLRLVFHAGDRIDCHEAAAAAAFAVGTYWRTDDHGRQWPRDRLRAVCPGDVIKVTGPDHWIRHFRVDHYDFYPVPEPTTVLGLPALGATIRP
ncbi:hypothetical protein [Streptomyces sp. NPDC001037]|uniref:hypothetical protein n=1 Tax=Streptomyces sp. NPDC001037 TaxID=3364542 RepID=UPI00369373A6